MTTNHIENYIRWITPGEGDPTFSILKAHLLLEELLRAHLTKTLPHPGALSGARLTFTQLLAVARASSPGVPEDCWIWKAIADLNKIRNMLSHETNPKDIKEKMAAYVRYVQDSLGVPLPPQITGPGQAEAPTQGHRYQAIDMATVALYYVAADRFGFNVDATFAKHELRDEQLGT